MASSEKRILINKAKSIAPGVRDIKGAFALRSHNDFARTRTMHIPGSKASEFLRPRVDFIEIADREIDVIGERLRLFTTGNDVNQRQNYWTAIDVVSRRARNPSAGIVKQLRVKLSRFVEIVNLHYYSE